MSRLMLILLLLCSGCVEIVFSKPVTGVNEVTMRSIDENLAKCLEGK